jgi:protein TonB
VYRRGLPRLKLSNINLIIYQARVTKALHSTLNMKNIFISIITLFLFCLIAEAQQDTIFYNSDWKETKVKDSVEFYRLVKFDTTVKLYAVTDYYKEGKPQMKAFSSDKKGEIFEGKVEWFAKEGFLEKYINYKNDVKQGESKTLNPDGTVWGEGFYKDDYYDGEWKWYYPNRQLSVIETYTLGKLIALKGWDENGKEQLLDIRTYQQELDPEFPGGYSKMVNFVINNLKYPKKARIRNIEGIVYVMFSVETDGSLTNLKIARSVDELLDNEALRVVSLMPKWEVGKIHNLPVKVNKVTIPFNFQLTR